MKQGGARQLIGLVRGSAVAVLVCALPVIGAVAAAQPGPEDRGGSLTFIVGVPITTLAPGKSTATIANTVTDAIYETLVERDATSTVVPSLATSWELASDGLTWTFKLQEGVTFHDGSAFTSEDVRATFARLLDPGFALPLSSIFAQIASVDVVDDYTISIVTSQPTPDLLTRLSWNHASIISSRAVAEYGADIDWTPVGTGPYRFDSYVPEESITLSAFDAYWGDGPYLDSVVFRTVVEPGTRVSLLEVGEADVVVDLPPTDVARLAGVAGLEVLQAPSTRLGHIGVNTQAPPFDDVLVRRALNYAIDREGLVAGVLHGIGQPAQSIVSPTVANFADVSPYDYDPQQARALLAEAGYPNGFNAVLWTPEGRYFQDRATAVAVQSMLADIGVNVEVRVIDWATYLQVLRNPREESETQLYLLGWESGTGDVGYILDLAFHSSTMPPAGWNTMFYSNPEVDALIEASRSEMDLEARRDVTRQIQELVVNDAPWVILYVYQETAAVRSSVQGLEMLPGEVYSIKQVWLER